MVNAQIFKHFSLSVKFSNKMFVFRAGIHKMRVRIANRKTLIRLLLQKQSDLGLPCLSRSFLGSQLVFEIFRTFMAIYLS